CARPHCSGIFCFVPNGLGSW
nr:immunoglobulin heavy chain junction region [Macaca mulatta]MOV54023.1 immunoglobulin heavy chain junction region [Macaca mulatta]MOV54160.1 immunoglobulin heavy chain junction region [Macaca mulatta]MOV54634.1 immunoglobulin heavy chain junction region [Macaca mulatta]MOV55335.1 immunoglobulin heavy chain junction region [Macaca mulatta]